MTEFKPIPKTWLITGGCGFIGTNLVEHLKQNYDCKIRVVDNLSVGQKEDLADVCAFVETDKPITDTDKIELWVGDIMDSELALRATKDIDCIVHLAANTGVIPSIEDPRKDCETNVMGTLNYLEAARLNKVNKFIFASSGAPLGEQEPPIHEEKVPHPIAPYGASKLAGEGYCMAYHGSYGLNTIILRFSNVYGPRSHRKNSVVAKFIKQALHRETLKIYGDGNQTRDFIYVSDLVRAIIQSSKSEIRGEVFQIASNNEININKIAKNISRILFNKKNIKTKIIHCNTRQGEIKRNYSDISKVKGKLNWAPKHKFEIGIGNTYDDFIKEKIL